MKGILFGQLVLLLVFVIHAILKCQATFCIDHYNKLVKEIREHQSHCSDQVKNQSPCCDSEASSLEERRRNYKILCQQEIICGSAKEDCSKYATCTNTGPGSYECTCNKGYIGMGKTCRKEIICGSAKEDCSKYATCTNTGPGSYECTCNKGYIGDGKTCRKEIICGSAREDCSKNAICTNTGPGSYQCTCNEGYIGDGKTCCKEGKIDKLDLKKKEDINRGGYLYPGEWYVIDCRLSDSTINVSLWQDKKKIVSDQHKVMELNQVFNITNVTFNDEGDYYCKVCNTKVKSLGYLEVGSDGLAYQKPEILNKFGNIYNITYGSNLDIVCEVAGYYEMVWYKNGKVVGKKKPENNGYETADGIHITKESLTIKRFTERDNGIYTCEVQRTNVGWKAKDYVHLKVKEVKPFIRKTKQQHIVNNNQKFILLRCGVEKVYPSAVFHWSECIGALYNCRKDEKVGWFKRNGNSFTNESTLNVTLQQQFHKVSYRCTARNKLGQDTFVHEIIYKIKPKIREGPLEVVFHKDINLKCELSNQPIPQPNISWTQCVCADGKCSKCMVANCSQGENTKDIIGKMSTFSITQQTSEKMMYRCIAENEAGCAERKWIILKAVKPKIREGPLEVVFHKNINLKCELSNQPIPQPNISWTQCVCADGKCSKCMVANCSQGENTKDIIGKMSTFSITQQTSEKMMYRCIAENEAGCAERKWIILKAAEKGSTNVYLITIYCTIGLMLIFLVIIAMVLYRRKKLYGGFYIFTAPPMIDYITRLDEDKSLIEQSNKLPYITEWEFPRERVQLEKDIGNGAFGRVYLAGVIGLSAFNPREALEEKSKQNRLSFFRNGKRKSYLYCTMIAKAAVKMLNDNWNESELSDLLTELKLLIHVGQHNNVVNILGACTQGPRGKAWIIMEYCKHGNLSQFLKERRTIFESGWPVFSEDQNTELSHSDLTAISLQVALGMKFLVSRKCIHRNLAARNVLIGDGFVPKIADFGLARNIKNEQYVKKNSGLLPIKWMSIEAIRDMVFTKKSDIWSFGILLWEIFSMGGSPYIGIPGSQIYEYLCQGNRMQPPVDCPSDIYDVMLECWETEQDERPDFQTVEEKFAKILMAKNRPWIYQFELQSETEASPKNNKNISYKLNTSSRNPNAPVAV